MDQAESLLGVSTSGVLKPKMSVPDGGAASHTGPRQSGTRDPADLAKQVRPDCNCNWNVPISKSGQQCPVFPIHIPRALDVGATTINEEMKLAATWAIAALAKEWVPEAVVCYKRTDMCFGEDYLIPAPFDPRLIVVVSLAVAEAAMATNVASRPIADMFGYRETDKALVMQWK